MVFLSSATSCSTSLSRGDTKSMLKSGQIPIGQYQQIKDLPIPDNAKEII
jgi:hypothetical protein